MRIVNAGFSIESQFDGLEVLKHIERAGRTCYKSEVAITEESARAFVSRILGNKHESVLEHFSISVRIICDRGVSHEIVRHRLASYSQESTRYCNYSKEKYDGEITVIAPCFFVDVHPELSEEMVESRYKVWRDAMLSAEKAYMALTSSGASAQEARSVLPNSLKTEMVMTMNLREWRHFFKLRAAGLAGRPHPQMLEIAVPMLKEFQRRIPVVFDDIQGL